MACIRGCSHMTSAKNGGVQTPPPPLVNQSQKLAYLSSPPCQKKSETGLRPSNSQVKLSPRPIIFLKIQFFLILHEHLQKKTNRFTNLYAKSLRKKKMESNSQLKYVFGLMTNIGKNFAETLQFEDLAVKNVQLSYSCVLCPVSNIRYTAVYSIQQRVYNNQYSVLSIHYTVYSIQYTVFSIQNRVYSIKYTVNSRQCINYTVYRIQCSIFLELSLGLFLITHRYFSKI